MIKKICCKCKLEKDYCDFGKLKSSTDGLRYECKSCRKNHRIENIEKIKEQELNRRVINRDELNLKQKEYRKVHHEELKIKRTEYILKNQE